MASPLAAGWWPGASGPNAPKLIGRSLSPKWHLGDVISKIHQCPWWSAPSWYFHPRLFGKFSHLSLQNPTRKSQPPAATGRRWEPRSSEWLLAVNLLGGFNTSFEIIEFNGCLTNKNGATITISNFGLKNGVDTSKWPLNHGEEDEEHSFVWIWSYPKTHRFPPSKMINNE